MTDKQAIVLWLGIGLVLVNLFTSKQAHKIWATLMTGAATSEPGKGGSIPTIPVNPISPFLPLNNKGGTNRGVVSA